MKRAYILKLIIKLGLFALTLALGTMLALNAGETEGLARVDLSDVPVDKIITVVDDDVLYAKVVSAAQAGGFYRSLDNGRTWENLSKGPETTVNTLTIDSDDETIIYAGGAGGPLATTKSLWRSEDGGYTWQKFNLNLPASPDHILPDITALGVDPKQPDLLYVGTDGQGVYRLSEAYLGYDLVGGASMYNAHVKNLAIGADSQLFALMTEGLFMAENDSWRKLETPEAIVSIAVAPDEPNMLYVGGASMGVYRSTDNGQTWEQINHGLDLIPGAALRVTALTVDKAKPNAVALATAYGLGSQLAPGSIYESDHSGEGWTKVADLDSLVTHLSLNKGVIHATTVNSLKRFDQVGETPLEAASITSTTEAGSLTNPSTIQTVILLLTIVAAVLILINPMHWLEGWQERAEDI